MSREIKFRAWLKPRWEDDEDANKMYYDIQGSYDNLGNVKPYDPMTSFASWFDDEVAIVEQCTGLTDKNGKEIYEGDIIKARDWDGDWGKYRIKWKQSHCAFEAFECRKHGKMNWTLQGFGGIEVIGNVHENPELIGGKE